MNSEKLMICEDCDNKISKKADQCPHCGRNYNDSDDNGSPDIIHEIAKIAAPVLIVIGLIAMLRV